MKSRRVRRFGNRNSLMVVLLGMSGGCVLRRAVTFECTSPAPERKKIFGDCLRFRQLGGTLRFEPTRPARRGDAPADEPPPRRGMRGRQTAARLFGEGDDRAEKAVATGRV